MISLEAWRRGPTEKNADLLPQSPKNRSSEILSWLPCLLAATGALNALAQAPRVEGPVVLHAAIADQWGGHTFNYVISGQSAVFWAATAHRPDKKQSPKLLVGQHPKDSRSSPSAVKTLELSDPSIIGLNQPQMVRSPEGILHVFVGSTHSTPNPKYNVGRLHYPAVSEVVTSKEGSNTLQGGGGGNGEGSPKGDRNHSLPLAVRE